MADGQTPNFGWVLPQVHASANSWGDKLNSNLNLIDAEVHQNAQSINTLNGRVQSNILTLVKSTVAAGAYIASYLNTTMRWVLWLGDGTAEAGGNSGSDLAINRYADNGSYIDTPVAIYRQTGQVIVSQAPTTAQSVATKAYVDAGINVVGSVTMFAGVTPPNGWTWCGGQAVSRTQYATLFGVIGTRFGAGDGSTTFNLPNLFGRVPVGYDGGGWAMGLLGGVYTLTQNEMPVHSHLVNDAGHAHGVNQTPHAHVQNPHSHGIFGDGVVGGTGLTPGGNQFALAALNTDTQQPGISAVNANVSIATAATGINLQPAGAGATNGNMQPYQVLGYIIRVV